MHARDDSARPDLPAGSDDVLGVRARDRGEVGDRGLGRVQASHSANMRLDFRELRSFEPPKAGHAVRARALLQTSERLEL